MLQEWLADVPISSFVATLLGSQDGPVISSAVQMAEILMQKQPKVFSSFFLKEGVAHAIDQLASEHVPAPPADAAHSPPPPVHRTKAHRRSSSRLKVIYCFGIPMPGRTRGSQPTQDHLLSMSNQDLLSLKSALERFEARICQDLTKTRKKVQ